VRKLRIQSSKPIISKVNFGSDMSCLGKIGFGLALMAVFLTTSRPLSAREKDTAPYGEGLIVNVPFPQSEVTQVVQDVVQNGIIRGTKEYNKDEYISGATAEHSVKVFPAWTEGGEVFYKVRTNALDPRNFKNSGDVGTLAVRYVVQPQGEKNTVLHINAVFVEEFRHTMHLSNGSVESAEYKDIHDRLDELAVMKTQAEEALRERQEQSSSRNSGIADARSTDVQPTKTASANTAPTSAEATTLSQPPALTPEEHLKDLKRQVERLVKAPGAALRSAPFHTASTLQSLPAGSEVLIVITTPYWLGIETHDGQHGWMLRDDLELVP
jgi:hypothetical protein